MRRLAPAAVLLLAALFAHAEVKPFEAGSLARIKAAREGRPFILALWSQDCVHCPKELQMLGRLRKQHPNLDIVLVATDTPEHAPELARFAASRGLAGAEQWVFADAQPERLRFEIDRRWWGEMPRTYLFERDHQAAAYSGVIDGAALAQWLARNLPAGRPAQ